MDKIIRLSNNRASSCFKFHRNGGRWKVLGPCTDDGKPIEDTSVNRKLGIEIAHQLKNLTEIDEWDVEEEDEDEFDGDIVTFSEELTLSERMKDYTDRFHKDERIVVEEFGVKFTISWFNDSYKAKPHLPSRVLIKVCEKYGHQKKGQRPIILLDCGVNKDKVVPLAIREVQDFSLFLGKVGE